MIIHLKNKNSKLGTERYVERFLWLPVICGNQFVWLEWVSELQVCTRVWFGYFNQWEWRSRQVIRKQQVKEDRTHE